MPLTVSQGEGMMVISITSNPKSKWPVLCQILSSLSYGPVCFASEDMKEKLTDTQRVIGAVQIMVGVMNIKMGCFGFIFSFWIGGVLVIGIVTVLAAKFPSPFLVMILNVVSAALAITAAVLYSMDLATGNNLYCDTSYYSSNGYAVTPSTEQMRRTEICVKYKYLNKMILGGLDIMMIVLSVLQLCVTISFCVLTGKALCKKDEDDPELHKPLLEDDTPGPAC
uniref:Transmembrane protein 176l.1 n=1 Tax=Sinocyclocheilus grahami TaxID=75366 RepID=A0A672S613_SINGR